MSKNTTAIATISKDNAVAIIKNAKTMIATMARDDNARAYAVGEQIALLKRNNAHILDGTPNFVKFIEKEFSDTDRKGSTLRQWCNAFLRLDGLVPREDMGKWFISAVGLVADRLDKDFRAAVNAGDIVPETFDEKAAKAFNAAHSNSKASVVTTYAPWDFDFDEPQAPVLYTKDEIKTKVTGERACYLTSFKPQGKPEYLVLVHVWDDMNVTVSYYRAYSEASAKADKEAAEKAAKLAETLDSIGLTKEQYETLKELLK